MKIHRIILLLAASPLAMAAAAAGGATPVVRGDVVVIEEVPPLETAPQESGDIAVPTRGMDMDNVRNVFGEPLTAHPAVGDPPITRWDYDGFSVFFEHDKVIHSVVTA